MRSTGVQIRIFLLNAYSCNVGSTSKAAARIGGAGMYITVKSEPPSVRA